MGAIRRCTKHILTHAFVGLRVILDWLIDFVFGFIYSCRRRKKLPGVKERIILNSATALARQIRERQISSEKVVTAFIERIKEVNNLLNAVVDTRFDEAIQDAKNVDKFLSETHMSLEEIECAKPLLGVPFTSKESTAAKGMAFTFGLVSRKGKKALYDAIVVKRMKDSGAILVGVSNIPEFNLGSETRNKIYGQTQNPYDFSRTVGGSSGGEAAIISACGSPLGVGADIGGSARMPPYYCGIFGHKPTTGLITTHGLTFRKGDEGDTMVSAGVIVRYAEDITPMLKVLIGGDVKKFSLDKKVNLQDVKVSYCVNPRDLRVSKVSKEIVTPITKAANHFSTVSRYQVEKVSLEGFNYSAALWRHEMTKEPGKFAYDLSNRKGNVSLIAEILKMIVGKSQFTMISLMRLVDLKILPSTDKKWAEDVKCKLSQEVLKLLGDNGVLLFPSCPTDAPYHYTSFLRPYNFAYWGIFNVLRLPVTQVPLGLSKKGLPIGLQVVAGPNNDHLCIAVAQELERVFGGWDPPFPSLPTFIA